jgi:hypothetical protein
MKKFSFFALLACMLLCAPLRVWADSDDEALLEQVAKGCADLKGPLKKIGGFDIYIKQSATYQEKVFEVNCDMRRVNNDYAMPLPQIASMVKFYFEDQPKQTLALEVLLLEKIFPGFLDAMVKTKSTYRVQAVLSGDVYQYTGVLDSKELKQVERIGSSKLATLALQKGINLFNHVLLPYKSKIGNVLNKIALQDGKVWMDVQIPDKALTAIQKNMEVMKRAFYFCPTLDSGYSRDMLQSVDYGFRVTTDMGRRMEITYTPEERQQLDTLGSTVTDRQMYALLINIMPTLPITIKPYQTRVGFEYADMTLSIVDEVHTDNARIKELMKRPETLRSEYLTHLFGSVKFFENFSENGVGIRRIFRGLADEDLSYMMTAKEIDSLLKSPQQVKDSLLLQSRLEVLTLQMNQQTCKEGFFCPRQVSMEGDNVVWTIVGNVSLDSYKKYLQRDLRAKAIELYQSKTGNLLRETVTKLHKGLIYRVYSSDMKQHHDTAIPFSVLNDLKQ